VRVLIVDDEPMIVRMMKNYLEDRGFDVTTAATGCEAQRCIAEREYDAAIVDVRLPDMDGDRLIAAAARTRPSMRFFIHTGSIDYAPSEELKRLGVDEGSIIRKPVRDMDEIRRMLEGAVKDRRETGGLDQS